MNEIIKPKELSNEEIISLMGVYREEWKYRDETFLAHFFKFFSLSFFVTFFPNLAGLISYDGKSSLVWSASPIVFPILGILCALFGMYYSFCEASRIVNLDKVYYSLMNQLPEKSQKIELFRNDTKRNVVSRILLSIRLNNLLCVIYFFPIFVSILDIISLSK